MPNVQGSTLNYPGNLRSAFARGAILRAGQDIDWQSLIDAADTQGLIDLQNFLRSQFGSFLESVQVQNGNTVLTVRNAQGQSADFTLPAARVATETNEWHHPLLLETTQLSDYVAASETDGYDHVDIASLAVDADGALSVLITRRNSADDNHVLIVNGTTLNWAKPRGQTVTGLHVTADTYFVGISDTSAATAVLTVRAFQRSDGAQVTTNMATAQRTNQDNEFRGLLYYDGSLWSLQQESGNEYNMYGVELSDAGLLGADRIDRSRTVTLSRATADNSNSSLADLVLVPDGRLSGDGHGHLPLMYAHFAIRAFWTNPDYAQYFEAFAVGSDLGQDVSGYDFRVDHGPHAAALRDGVLYTARPQDVYRYGTGYTAVAELLPRLTPGYDIPQETPAFGGEMRINEAGELFTASESFLVIAEDPTVTVTNLDTAGYYDGVRYDINIVASQNEIAANGHFVWDLRLGQFVQRRGNDLFFHLTSSWQSVRTYLTDTLSQTDPWPDTVFIGHFSSQTDLARHIALRDDVNNVANFVAAVSRDGRSGNLVRLSSFTGQIETKRQHRIFVEQATRHRVEEVQTYAENLSVGSVTPTETGWTALTPSIAAYDDLVIIPRIGNRVYSPPVFLRRSWIADQVEVLNQTTYPRLDTAGIPETALLRFEVLLHGTAIDCAVTQDATGQLYVGKSRWVHGPGVTTSYYWDCSSIVTNRWYQVARAGIHAGAWRPALTVPTDGRVEISLQHPLDAQGSEHVTLVLDGAEMHRLTAITFGTADYIAHNNAHQSLVAVNQFDGSQQDLHFNRDENNLLIMRVNHDFSLAHFRARVQTVTRPDFQLAVYGHGTRPT